MRQEHHTIKRLLDDLRELVSADGKDSAVVLAEVEQLTMCRPMALRQPIGIDR